MESKVYSQIGKEAGKISLPESVFGLPWNADLVHQVAVGMMANARTPVAHTKTRGEVRGGGKKPWKQKGTGRARHGSSRSPIWVGGGVTHGPRNDKNYEKKINQKMKSKAFFTLLSKKAKDGEIIFVDKIDLKEAKTKHAVEVVQSISKISGYERIIGKKKNAAYIALSGDELKNGERAFRNIRSVAFGKVGDLNPLNLLQYKYLIVTNPEESVKALTERREKASKKKTVKA